MSHSPIKLSRVVKATRIPSGEPAELPFGAVVTITQALGGTFTVMVSGDHGLYRIDQDYADALGQSTAQPAPAPIPPTDGPITEETVWNILKTCYDPEIPVNIVDLGLIYSLKLEPLPDQSGTAVTVDMTLTAQGCGMGPVIAREAEQKIAQLPGISSAKVQVVWDPPWNPGLISAEGREKLGMI